MTILIPIEIILIINGSLLALSAIAVIIMTRASIIHGRSMGDTPIQDKQMSIIIRAVLLLIFIGLTASAFNLLII